MDVRPITIRDLRPSDVAAILGIQMTAPEMAQWKRADYEKLSHDPCGVVLVALSGEPDMVVGFLAALETGQEAEIQNLAVRADYRRRGVARALLEEVHHRLVVRSVGSVFLEVRLSNLPARQLYRAFGYSECGLRKRYYASDGEDALVLRRRLPDNPEQEYQRRSQLFSAD
jgi:[ribosomal protein S18]-alanine N-acetyltransferase